MISLKWQANSCWSSDLGLVLRSYFTVGPCLIECITGSGKVSYRAEERKMCVPQKIVPTWALNRSIVNKTVIYISFPWHCTISCSGSSTVEYEKWFSPGESFKQFLRLWTVFKNSAIWNLMSFLYLGSVFWFNDQFLYFPPTAFLLLIRSKKHKLLTYPDHHQSEDIFMGESFQQACSGNLSAPERPSNAVIHFIYSVLSLESSDISKKM